MHQRVMQVTIKKELVEKLPGGKTETVPFTTPFVEVGGGTYTRRFERKEEPFKLRGEEEVTAVLATGHFDIVEGSEGYEEETPTAPDSTPPAGEQTPPDAGQGEQPKRKNKQ